MKRTEVISKNRHIIFLTIISVFVVFAGVLVGCSNQNTDTVAEGITSENEAETESVEIPMSEPVEEVTSEIEKETIELSADEYYVDYPLSLDKEDLEHSGKQVYVKIPPLVNFYPEEEQYVDVTYLDTYTTSNYLITKLSADSEASVTYEMDNGEYTFINWCKEWDGDGWTYDVSEPEIWENGIEAYRVDAVFGGGDKTTQYVLYYPLEDDLLVLIDINGFLGTPYLLDDGELPEENEKILDFYRTEENLFIVVDPETTDVVTIASASEPVEELTEELAATPEPAEDSQPTETSETSKPAEEPAVTPAPTEPAQPAHTHSYNSVVTQATCANDGCITYTCSCGDTYTDKIPATGTHSYGYGEMNCQFCGTPHTHDWNIVVQTNSGVEIIPDEDFCCHSGWYFDTYEELRAHMDIPNVHGMVYLNDGSNGCTSIPPDYEGTVDFYASCTGWANCSGDGEGERIEYEITQEVQFCKICGVRGEATDVGERVILVHTYDD